MTDADKSHCVFAQGWFELGDYASALAELERIEPASRNDPDVLNLRWDITLHARAYDDALDTARLLTHVAPQAFEGWWKLSYTLHELRRTQEAYDNLVYVLDRFSGEWLLHYNLACYLARLSRLDEARIHLKTALELNPAQRADALADPDLEALRAEIQQRPKA